MPGRRKGRDDSDMGSEKEETGSFETLRDEGMYFIHVQQWQTAVDSFTRALDMNPDDNLVLVTRAKCYLQLGMAENALADAEQALTNEKKYIKGLLMKAEALYQLGHFETALVFFHRGHKLRQERGEFRLGIQKAQEAINNSIGGPSSVKLNTTGDLSFFDKQDNPVIEQEPPSEDETDKKSSKKKTKGKKEGKKEGKKDKKDNKKGAKGTKGAKSKKPPPKAYGKPSQQKQLQKERERPKSAADTKTIKQLLEELYMDKTYLEKLLNDENLTGGRSYMEREIKGHICDGLDYLHNRADFWRQQKPMYARKRDKERMRRSGKARPRDPVAYIMQNLEEIDEAQAEGKYETSLNTAKKLMKTVREMSEEDLANKWEIIANIHSQMGNAYLEMGKFSPAIDNHEADLDIAENNGLEDAKSRALDNIGRVYARKGNFEKAIEVWEKKLPLSKSPLEKTWLFHEIGRCYLESEKFDKAREYGEKSLHAAREADDDGWQLHASVLVAQSEVKSKEYQSAQASFEEALELAKRLEDDAAMNAVTKALEEVNDKIAKGYRAGEDEDEDEGDAKKVDYRAGEDDDEGRKSSQSKDSKRIRAGEDDDNDGRKSRGSSKAEYEDDFEEEKGVKEEIIDKAPTSPTRRSEGSGRRSVEAASPQKRTPLHSPTKRSLAGSPSKRSAHSPSKMSASSRRQTYSPTKQSREVSFKEGSAKGSVKGSAKGSAGGRSAPGSAQQRASPAAATDTGSARGSAKRSPGGFAATTESGNDGEEEIVDDTQEVEGAKGQTKAATPPPPETQEEAIEDESPQTKGQ